MVYDWDRHQQTCYRLYIEERKPLEDIMEHMRVHHQFAPRYVAPETALVVPVARPVPPFPTARRTCAPG